MLLLGVLQAQAAGGGGVAPSTPPVGGYSLWLEAADESTFSFSSGAVVSEWRDKSGNGYHFSQATVAEQPIREAPGLVAFDGSDDWLEAGSKFMNNAHNGGSNTFFIVVAKTGDNEGVNIISTGWNSSANVGFGIGYGTTKVSNVAVRRGVPASSPVRSLSSTAQTTGTLGVLTIKLDADNATAINRARHFLNTGSAEGDNTDTPSPSASASTYNPGIAGDGQDLTYADIKVAEILWYQSELSDTDREAVRDHLITKWGI